MLFGRRKPTPLPEASRMGFRSRLVLAKLGFDLRQRYDALIGRERTLGLAAEPKRCRGGKGADTARPPMVKSLAAVERRDSSALAASKQPQGQSARNSSTAFSNSV